MVERGFELLAPAGTWDAFVAAVNNGADAVYLGGKLFNARSSAGNFDLDEIESAVHYAKQRKVKIYVTVNTLVRDEEMNEALEFVGNLYRIGVDAVILQDIGLASMIKELYPHLALHASTQMTVHNQETALFLQKMGFSRIIMERQMTMSQLVAVRGAVDIEIEVFAHGALCISYSGQCLMSSMIGGRSGNRGRCAQPCRLEYDLCGKKSGLINHDEGAHLLSTKDLNLITVLPELYQNGISGIKIEGRMKRPEYVATVVRIYREAIDRLLQTPEEYYVGADDLRQLEQIFNRDFTKGFLWNESGKKLMSLKRPNNRGVFIGRIVEIDPPKKIMRIKLEKDMSVGDGIEIWVSVGGRVGTTIEKMYVSDSERSDAYTGEIATIYAEGNFRVGDRVFRTHDEKLISTAQKTYIDVETARRIPLEADVKLRLGEPMILTLKDPKGNIVREESDRISEKASAYPMTEKQIEKQLERTGNTSFSINTYSWNIEPGLFMPVSIINELRRKAVNKMEALYAREYEPSDWNMAEKRLRSYLSQSPFRKGKEVKKVIPRLSVTVDELDALEAAARSGADIIYWGGDLLNWNTSVSWPELQSRVDKSSSNHVELAFAYPRITKDEEQKEIEERFLSDRDCLPNWIRIANWGQLATANNLKALVSVDYPMYAFNSASLEFYHKMGASRVTISPELTLDQIAALQKPDGLQIEALVHGQIPVMISDYCPISTVMDGTQSPGKKCSQSLCRIDRYSLRDKLGYNFPVITNSSCRSFIFNSKELCLFDNLEEIIRSGISILRLEAIQRGASYTAQIVSAYRHWIDRHEKMVPLSDSEKDHVKSLLVDLSFNGITKGHYFRGVE